MLFNEHKVDTPAGRIVTRKELIQGEHVLKCPYVLKECDGGSSLNTFLIKEGMAPFNKDNCPFETVALAEEYIPGEEYTVPVWNGKAVGIV